MKQPVILDRFGRIVNGSIGPEKEGDDLILTCRVTGGSFSNNGDGLVVRVVAVSLVIRSGNFLSATEGSPPPRVRWLVPNVAIEEYVKSAADVTENKLTMRSLQRSHLGLNFTCIASNTNLVSPKKKSVTLDLILKPVTVNISRPPGKVKNNESLQAKHRYDLECETTGSNPPAVITWYKGKRPLKHVREERTQNRTISRVEFVPSVEDNRKSVTCRAENPSVKGLFLEQSWLLDVVYKTKLLSGGYRNTEIEYEHVTVKSREHARVTENNVMSRIQLRRKIGTRTRVDEQEKGLTMMIGKRATKKQKLQVMSATRSYKSNPPIVSLSLGSTLNSEDIKEGDDAYFECHINSNPPISKFIWIHNVS
ncbi:hypothetical protein PV325_003791 [Microctonus aethiopoides]|nr:hypothetical protein PV325_003791 [Microctonus aethiopoides]